MDTIEDTIEETGAAPHKVLIVDDDPQRRRAWEAGLRAEGFVVATTSNSDAAIALLGALGPDVVVINPEMHVAALGCDLFSAVRRASPSYVVAAMRSDDHIGRVRLLRSGADVVMSATESCAEFTARLVSLRARMRRGHRTSAALLAEAGRSAMEERFGPLTIDFERRSVRLFDRPLELTRIEWALLVELCRQPGAVLSRGELLASVWGDGYSGGDHVVEVHLSNLRNKLADVRPGLRCIRTLRGAGYCLSNDLLMVDAMASAG